MIWATTEIESLPAIMEWLGYILVGLMILTLYACSIVSSLLTRRSDSVINRLYSTLFIVLLLAPGVALLIGAIALRDATGESVVGTGLLLLNVLVLGALLVPAWTRW